MTYLSYTAYTANLLQIVNQLTPIYEKSDLQEKINHEKIKKLIARDRKNMELRVIFELIYV